MIKTVEVRSFEEACVALKDAHEGGYPIILQNSKLLHKFGGFMYTKHIMEEAIDMYPDVDASIIYDADSDAVVAITAMTGGFKKVRFSGNKTIYKKLCDIALQTGAEILD